MSDDEYFGRLQEGPPTDQSLSTQNEETAPESIDPSSVTAHLTLVDIERLTGISYVSLQRYAQQFADRLSHLYEGTGRNRRYYPSAVEEFKKIKAEIAERRKGAGAEAGTEAAGSEHARRGSKKRSRSRPRKKPTPKKAAAAAASPRMPLFPLASTKKAQATSPEPAASLSSDLDRLAHTYQLSLQLKTLDAVQEFVSEWRAKLEAELATLKLKEG